MKQEIGGYLELEVFHGKEYYPDLVKVNLGPYSPLLAAGIP